MPIEPRHSQINPGSPANGDDWVSVPVAAAAIGVSVRAVQKRCASGTLPARRVRGARGEVWEVRANFNANDERELKANTNANVRRQVRAQIPLPVPNEGELRTNQRELEGERRTFESERERELKDEVRFLRSIIEQLQRDGAETRAALRKALEIAPRQLAQGSGLEAQAKDAGVESSKCTTSEKLNGDELEEADLLAMCRRICPT